MTEVLLATCAEFPAGDEDGDLLVGALRDEGVSARWANWDDPDVDWSSGLVVLRSTWDYTRRLPQFLAWAQDVPRLLNPLDVVRWNSDKVYFRDLLDAGVPCVPTRFAAPGEVPQLPGSGEFVVKPSVGAGSRGAGRFRADEHEAALEHVRDLHDEGRTVLVQPYLDAVDEHGETALIHIDATFSHAVRKGPMLAPGTRHPVLSESLFVAENISAREPSPAERSVAGRVMATLGERFADTLLYARIDVLPGADGPVVIEVEVTEPSLSLGHAPGAAQRLAKAIGARL